jgi:tRNA(adenine34) deaminase
MNDSDYMDIAYSEAISIEAPREYPVGAVVVLNGEIISKGRNTEVEANDPTGHAEINAIRAACKKLQSHKLKGATLYTTLFPCPMCEGVILEASIEKVVYGADPYLWVREVKFNSGNIQYSGPLQNVRCRDIFTNKLKELGRDDILSYKNS